MHAALLTYGTQGDVQPFVALARALQRAGHSAHLAAPAQYQQLAAPYGIPYSPLPGTPTDFMTQLADHTGKNPLNSFRIMRKLLLPLAGEVIVGLRKACQDADIIVHSFMTGTSGHAMALEQGVPDVSVQFFPVFASTSAFPSLVSPALRLGKTYNRLTHDLFALLFRGFEQFGYRWIKRTNPAFPRKLEWPFRSSQSGGTPILFAFSPQVVPRPDDWGKLVHLTGYWFMDEPETWQPPDHLVKFLSSGSPPVSVSFSSMKSQDSPRIYSEVLKALSNTNQRAVLLSGGNGLKVADDENLLLMDAVPHEWLFPRMKAVIHHGGAGTTAAALRAGVPNIVVPFANDQPFWGERVAAINAGPQPIPARKLNAEMLETAIRESIENKAMRQQAANIGRRLAAEDGVGRALEVIENLVQRRTSGLGDSGGLY